MSSKSKQQWRTELRQARDSFARTQTREQQHQLAADLVARALPLLAPFRIIGSYVAVGSEIDPALIGQSLPSGVTLALPRVTGPAQPLTFHAVTSETRLVPGYGNIPAPPENAPCVIPDALLVPLIGVDRRGIRLGQGQGHYDSTISSLRANAPLFVIGIAYDCQLVATLPCEAHDQVLDVIVTPDVLIQLSH
jgi:5-formyltetrahydrofolate cyclo-ligase